MGLRVPARQLHLFHGKRQRGRAPPAPKEFATHCALADMLRRWASAEWRWSHFAAGEERPAGAGARLKRMGLQRGWPDFLFFHVNGRCCFLELKRRGSGRMSEAQSEIAAFLIDAGHDFLCTSSFDEAITWLKAQGILRGGIAVQ